MLQHSSIKISPARAATHHILLRIGRDQGHSDDLLHMPAMAKLSAADRNLATTLVMGVLRWQMVLDAEIRRHLSRPAQRIAEEVMVALRLGVFQLRYLDRIPAHAALSESVELCRANGQPQATGMVNAVLRKISREATHASVDTQAALAAHPKWLVERWAKNYGEQAAEAICLADQRSPAEERASGFFVAAETELPPMDDGSRLVAELAATGLSSAVKILDCCAAPGGKTLILALRNPQARIVATDISGPRLQRMQQRLAQIAAAGNVEYLQADAAQATEEHYDRILCDVPCSGTGTLAGNPEIRHHLKLEDITRQAERQSAILQAALKELVPGGRVLYSTCSLEPEENEQVVEACLQGQDEFHCLPMVPLLDELAQRNVLLPEAAKELQHTAVHGACLRTLPGVHPCDGFFAAMIERRIS